MAHFSGTKLYLFCANYTHKRRCQTVARKKDIKIR